MTAGNLPSLYREFTRPAWARLRANTPLTVDADRLTRLTGLGDHIDLTEVQEVYLPLSRLLMLYVQATHERHRFTQEFFSPDSSGAELPPPPLNAPHLPDSVPSWLPPGQPPFVIGIAGSVAVGKSTIARLLREVLRAWPGNPRVELVTTDGFLLPNEELRRRNLLHRKGFPESYNRRSLLRFVAAIKAGQAEVHAPVYSHLSYDVLPGEYTVLRNPDIVIVEGLNVLQPPRGDSTGRSGLAVSDFFDFSVYADARVTDIRAWYVDRFLRLRATAFADPSSYFHRYATLSDSEAIATAEQIWSQTNEPNLIENIRPTRPRATLILSKDANHTVTRVRLRKT
ncbi:MAG: type I pantothenate kinase [Actinomycetota bacterium]